MVYSFIRSRKPKHVPHCCSWGVDNTVPVMGLYSQSSDLSVCDGTVCCHPRHNVPNQTVLLSQLLKLFSHSNSTLFALGNLVWKTPALLKNTEQNTGRTFCSTQRVKSIPGIATLLTTLHMEEKTEKKKIKGRKNIK